MKLTKLRLLGFKSFVEPTDFLIEPGWTGVVGPNGCGKSNLVEPLRGLMGETSHKSMRAADMEDVIFSGNSGRPPRNNAEGAIAIDNTDRSAPSQVNGEESLEGARRADPVRRRIDRRALPRAGASRPHRRNHPGQARAAPPRAGGSRRHLRV